MTWPSPQEYNEAIQMAAVCFKDPELQTAHCEQTKLGLPKVTTGAFASVYRFRCQRRDVAVRCFLSRTADCEERYARISEFVMGDNLPYTVDFEYQREGVLVRGQWYPILKMDWVSGQSLTEYVSQNLRDQSKLESLLLNFQQMMFDLAQAGIAHGDLQHGNILVGKGGELRLVDYDGMYVPALQGCSSNELGHRNYQHPDRTRHTFGPYLDNFSAWIIDSALTSLLLDLTLWRDFGVGDESLLLRQSDFQNPASSRMFLRLLSHKNAEISRRARLIQRFLSCAPADVPYLNRGVILLKPADLALPTTKGSLLGDYVTAIEQQSPDTIADLWSSDNIQALSSNVLSHTKNTAVNFQEVIQLLQARRQDEALAMLTRNIAIEDLMIHRARGETKLGNYDLAIRNFYQVIASAPNDANAHLELGIAMVAAGEFSNAIKTLERARSLAPGDGRCHCFLAVAHQKLHNHKGALVSLKECTNVTQDYMLRARAHDLAVVSLCILESHNDAIKSYERARRYNPAGAIADEVEQAYHVSLGFVQSERGEFQTAVEHFQRAREIGGPVSSEIIDFGLGLVLMGRGKFKDALRQFAKIERRGYSSKLMYFLIGIAVLEKEAEIEDGATRSAVAFAKALTTGSNPTLDAEIYIAWSKALKSANRIDKQKVYLQKAIELNPNHIGAHVQLSALYHEEGHHVEAAKLYERLAEIDKSNSDWHMKIGLQHMVRKDYQAALDNFSEAISRCKQLPEAYYNRALAGTQLRAHEAAIGDLTQCLEYQPKHTAALYALAVNYCFVKDYVRAEQAVNEALEQTPGWTKAIKLRAKIYYEREDYKQASVECAIVLNSEPDDVETKVILGKCAGKLAQYDQCIAALEPILASESLPSKDSAPWAILADSFLALGKDEQCLETIELAHGRIIGQLDADLWLIRGQACVNLFSKGAGVNYCGAAIDSYSKYCKLRPNDSRGYLKRAEVRRRQKAFFVHVVADYETALSIEETVEAHLGIAAVAIGSYDDILYDSDGDAFSFRSVVKNLKVRPLHLLKKGVKSFDRARELEANLTRFAELAHCWRWKGVLAELAGDSKTALECYSQSIELSPDDSYSYSWRAALLMVLNRYEDALADLNRLNGHGGESATLARAECLYELRRYDEALGLLVPLCGSHSCMPAAIYLRALTLEMLARLDDAVKDYVTLLNIGRFAFPYKDSVPLALAQDTCVRLIALCDEKRVWSIFKELRRTPENYVAIAQRALLRNTRTEFGEAIKDFEHAIKCTTAMLHTEDEYSLRQSSLILQQFYCGRATSFLSAGKSAKAEEDLQHALSIGRSYAVLLQLSECFIRQKKFERAISTLREAELKDSADPTLYRLLTVALKGSGRSLEAESIRHKLTSEVSAISSIENCTPQ